MSWIIDRFEEDIAVLEEAGKPGTFSLPRLELPPEAKEGDALSKDAAGNYIIDADETGRRRARIKSLLERLKKR